MMHRHCVPHASDLTFTSVFALIPTLGLLIVLFNSFDTLRELNIGLEDAILRFLLPHVYNDIAPRLMSMISQVAILHGWGIVFALGGMMWLFHTIAVCFDYVWDGNREYFCRGMNKQEKIRYILKRIERYIALFLALYVGLAFSFWITGELKELVHYDALENHKILSLLAYELLAAAIAFVVFLLLYKYIPGQKEKEHEPRRQGEPGQIVLWQCAAVGAFVASVAWEILKLLLYGYFVFSPTLQTLYGPFVVIPAALLWLFVTWLVILYGLTVASVRQADTEGSITLVENTKNDQAEQNGSPKPQYQIIPTNRVEKAPELADGLGRRPLNFPTHLLKKELELEPAIRKRINLIWEKMENNGYDDEEGKIDLNLIMQEGRDILREVAVHYHPEKPRVEFDVSAEDLIQVFQRATSDLLDVLKSADRSWWPINPSQWTITQVNIAMGWINKLLETIAYASSYFTGTPTHIPSRSHPKKTKSIILSYISRPRKVEIFIQQYYRYAISLYSGFRRSNFFEWLTLSEGIRIYLQVSGVAANTKIVMKQVMDSSLDINDKQDLIRIITDENHNGLDVFPEQFFEDLEAEERNILAGRIEEYLQNFTGLKEEKALGQIANLEKRLDINLRVDKSKSGHPWEGRVRKAFEYLLLLARYDVEGFQTPTREEAVESIKQSPFGQFYLSGEKAKRSKKILDSLQGDSVHIDLLKTSLLPPDDIDDHKEKVLLVESAIQLLDRDNPPWPSEIDSFLDVLCGKYFPNSRETREKNWKIHMKASLERLKKLPGVTCNDIDDHHCARPILQLIQGENQLVAAFEGKTSDKEKCWVAIFRDRIFWGKPMECLVAKKIEPGSCAILQPKKLFWWQQNKVESDDLVIRVEDPKEEIVILGDFRKSGWDKRFEPVLNKVGTSGEKLGVIKG